MNEKKVQRKPITFRQFSRKSWSLFSCLGREVRIGVLGVCTLACAAPRLQAATPLLLTEDEAEEREAETPADTLQLG